MSDGLSGKHQMIICFECHHAFFGTDAKYHEETYAGKEFSEPLESELTETLTDEELNKVLKVYDIDIKECCANNRAIYSCCDCEGHEWVTLDSGETIECRHCDADITLDEVQALYEPDY